MIPPLPIRLYHGSRTVLQVGDWLLPPSETGAESSINHPYYGQGDENLVYLTDSFSEACKFAVTRQLPNEEAQREIERNCSPRIFVGAGLVYEAVPEMVSFVEQLNWHAAEYTCSAARITRVHKVPDIFVELRRRIEVHRYRRRAA